MHKITKVFGDIVVGCPGPLTGLPRMNAFESKNLVYKPKVAMLQLLIAGIGICMRT